MESACQFFLKMRLFLSVLQQMAMATNVRDWVIVEIHVIRINNRNLYFVSVSIEQQLSKLLERDGIWAKIQQFKNKPNCSSSITDIVDGTVYKRYKESGEFLTKEDNLTLLFNTDGIPLFKSSKVNMACFSGYK